MGTATRSRKEIFRSIQPGPRAVLAARLYASGAVPTKRAACIAVGLSPSYLTVLGENEVIARVQDEVAHAIEDQSVSLSKVIALVSREAVSKVRELIKSSNEGIALKASSEILDRNPETSKTFKAAITNFSLDPADAKELAAALIASARVKQQYAQITTGDFVHVEELTNGKEGNSPTVATQDSRAKATEAAGSTASDPVAEAPPARPQLEIVQESED